MVAAKCCEIRIEEQAAETLGEYGSVSIAFTVSRRLRPYPVRGGLGGIELIEEAVEPYVKDYDAIRGEAPERWADRWDLSNWGVLAALHEGHRIGGAVIAWNTPGVDMLQGRSDLAVLWDLRVAPEWRGKRVGARLFSHAAEWSRQRDCREMVVETQNINVPACRFYAAQGCTLGEISLHAYSEFPEEAQLLWYRPLRAE